MEKSSFFNSVNGDRKYQASDFAAFFNSLLTNGVFPNPSTNLQIISNNNMTVTLKSGKAWINGYCYINDSDLILPITTADGVLNRIDRVVIQYNTVNRAINAVVKKGVFASTPVAPTLKRDADAYELGIADISINAGATSIVQANITDLRQNQDMCGIVNSLITADTKTLFAQFTDSFNTWFNNIKNTLGSDVAGNLQNEINTLNTTVTSSISNYKMQVITTDTDGNPTEIHYNRQDGTLYMKVVQSNPDAMLDYRTVVETEYATDGTTVVKTTTWSLTFTDDGTLTGRNPF